MKTITQQFDRHMTARVGASLVLCIAALIISPLYAHAETAALQYDNNGNITQRSVTNGAATQATTYTYDPLKRIKSEAGPAKSQSFDYDENGNRITDGAGSYVFETTSNRMTSCLGQAATYDAAGNLTADGTGKTFSYNQSGQLYQVKQNGTLLTTYYYDGMRQRTRKVTTASAPQGEMTVIYIYDQWGKFMEEFTGTGTLIRSYIWRDNTPVAQIEHTSSGDKILYFEVDHLNTPRAAMDETGKVVWRWESDAFGSTLPNEDPDGDGNKITINLRFAGQYYDVESGLHYNRHRYYDPKKGGRYTQPDPIGLAGGINPFTYVNSDPLSFIDPFGLFEITVTDSGGRNGLTYGGNMTVTGNNGQTVTVPVSTWPNPNNPSPGIQSGEYPGTYSPTGHQGRINGVRINNGGRIPTLGPNPAQNNQSYATGVNIHCGYKANRRGSAGCVTVDPAYCRLVWDILQPGETGTVRINR